MNSDQSSDRTPDLSAAESNGPDDHGVVEPASELQPADVASELFAHGLLHVFSHRDQAAQARRIDRVMNSIAAESHRRRLLFPRMARWALAAAAVIAIGTVVAIMGVPGETRALAAMQQTIKAMQSAGDRRYEIRIMGWNSDQPPTEPMAVVDTRSPGQIAICDRPPWSDGPVYVGCDTTGPWGVQPDGTVDREHPFAYWPPWATLDGTSMFSESIDGLLAQMPKNYTLTRLAAERLADRGDKLFDRISARRIRLAGHQAQQVELWIDPDTRLAERIEFRWDSPESFHAGGPDRSPGEGSREGPRGRPQGRDGPHHDHADMDRPPPAEGDDHHDQDFGDRPPRPHHHEHDEGHEHGDHPHPDGGHEGPGDRAKGMGPRGSGGGAPRLVVFERVDAPELPADWFSPEGHRER